jgi:hypothetical protein
MLQIPIPDRQLRYIPARAFDERSETTLHHRRNPAHPSLAQGRYGEEIASSMNHGLSIRAVGISRRRYVCRIRLLPIQGEFTTPDDCLVDRDFCDPCVVGVHKRETGYENDCCVAYRNFEGGFHGIS